MAQRIVVVPRALTRDHVGRSQSPKVAETDQDNLRGRQVVSLGEPLLNPGEGADERRELQILVRELDEFNAAQTALDVVSKNGQLHRPQRLLAAQEPLPIERFEPRGPVLPSGRIDVQIWVD